MTGQKLEFKKQAGKTRIRLRGEDRKGQLDKGPTFRVPDNFQKQSRVKT